MKKEVDGVIVEAKSILTALKIIKTVCKGLRNHAGGYGWKYREEVMKCSR